MELATLLVAGVLATSASTFGVTRSSSSRSSARSSTTTTRSTSRPSWSSNHNYGGGSGAKVGKASLKSRTNPPQPHDHDGKRYNSSDAIYTNHRGNWVYYWLPIGTAIYCYDKEHKRIDCDRDDKAYMKDW